MTHYQLVAANKRRSFYVVFFFMVFIGLAAYLMGYVFELSPSFIGTALIAAGAMSFGSYWFSDKIILSMSGAKPVTRQEYFDFYTVAENLASSQRMPLPKLYVINDSAMNAFATGRDYNHAVVVATSGLLSRLNRSEIEGVIAHELSHIKNYDMLLMSIVAILVGFIALLSDWMMRFSISGSGNRDNKSSGGQASMILLIIGFLLMLLSPLIANLVKLAISRKRELLADATAVSITKNPSGLIAALSKLDADREPLEAANKATAHLYIKNPLKNHHDAIGWFANLFQTHPPISQRIAALQGIQT